jgi:hypothetical protein
MFCKYIQWRLDTCLENQVPPTDTLLGHLQKCPTCRQYYQRLCQIDQQLRSRNPEPPDFDEKILQEKILARLSNSQPDLSSPFQRSRGFLILTAAGLAAVLLIVAGLWLLPHIPRSNPQSLTRADLIRFNQLISSEMTPLRSSLISQSMHQPLEKELDNLSRDMQRAVQFFAGCLPRTQEQEILSDN